MSVVVPVAHCRPPPLRVTVPLPSPPAAKFTKPPVTVVPPVKVLAAERTSVPAPLLAMAPAPVPPEPVWSAMTLEMVWVTPEPGAKFTVPLPCRNMPEPKAEPAVPWPTPAPPVTLLPFTLKARRRR